MSEAELLSVRRISYKSIYLELIKECKGCASPESIEKCTALINEIFTINTKEDAIRANNYIHHHTRRETVGFFYDVSDYYDMVVDESYILERYQSFINWLMQESN